MLNNEIKKLKLKMSSRVTRSYASVNQMTRSIIMIIFTCVHTHTYTPCDRNKMIPCAKHNFSVR